MFDKAIQFLKDHKEIALATCEDNLPKLRIFQIMKQEGHVLYFATSAQKAVYRELQARFAIQRENNYKKTGSSKAAFQTGCGTALFVPELSTE